MCFSEYLDLKEEIEIYVQKCEIQRMVEGRKERENNEVIKWLLTAQIMVDSFESTL